MTVLINRDYDDLFNILSTLHILTNYEYYKKQMEYQWELDMVEELEHFNSQFKANKKLKDAKHYFGVHSKTMNIFYDAQLQHESKDIHEYISLQINQNDDFLVSEVYRILNLNIDSSIPEIIRHLDKIEADTEMKWFYMQLIEDSKHHMNKAMKIIQDFIPLYKQIKESFYPLYLDFVDWITPILDQEGLDYLDQTLQFHNFKQYDKVVVRFSLLDLSATQIFRDNSIHVYLGIMFKKYIENNSKKDELINHTNVLKILSDPTRFKILLLLSEKERYGQELSELLEISTASISYHMDFLFSSELVIMERKQRRIYYSINKTNIKDSLEFIKTALNL